MEDRDQRAGRGAHGGLRSPREKAIYALRTIEELGFIVEAVSAPVPRHDFFRQYRWQIVVIVAGMVAVSAFSFAVLAGPSRGGGLTCEGSCPAAWAVSYESRVPPGATGCQGLQNETCYAFLLVSNVANVRLSGLRFEVIGPPWNNTSILNSPPVALGPSAFVSVLNSTGIQVGSWDWNLSSWIQGGWIIPVDANVTLVLDTGIQNAQLTGDYFETFMVFPDYGAVGVSLP